ncbi:RHS repeat-associated core domain-containing protein [Luteimonas fraxinea]|uniref:RHS repeat-associated core domain-containing protein n=1 Tax=Luteimonas fraxinea TaxID=2901869 RepID=UPI001E5D9107|nr:RHS repeat-associated core domain-containing protein [Luteimonas fraxinea]MCD9125996.1 RHS repeat-associated core domain-containing protein [Luteimonas fraxinea]
MSTMTYRDALLRLAFAALCILSALPAAAQTVYYVHTDALGSVVAETDAAGAPVSQREYEPYGQQLSPAVQDGPGYTGHVQDAATGLTYMQQRYYDSKLALFLSIDPVTAYQQPTVAFNRYRYANGNPYRFIDPDGRLGCAASRIASVCQGEGQGPRTSMEAGWSQSRRERTADAVISRASQRLAARNEGNRFKSTDDAGDFFKRQFAKLSTFLQLEFGAISAPGSNALSDFSRSVDSDFVNGVGSHVSLPPVPVGGAEYHTHPDLNPARVRFSSPDLVAATAGKGSAAYVFYGYPGYQGLKLDVDAARAAKTSPYSSDIHQHISEVND